MSEMIRIRNMHFEYNPDQPVLHDITLDLDARATAIIGQNGAGKTTLVKLLKGLLQPTAGEISVCGIRTKEATVAGLAGRIGLVFQNPNDQICKRTVLEEVMFGPLNLKRSTSEAKERAMAALDMVGLGARREMNPHDLGLSEKKLVSIASIVAMDTDILILDEPTIAQDDAGKRRIGGIIEQLKRQGKLVLAILHDMDFAAALFERTVVLNRGQVLMDDETRHVFSRPEILREAGLDTPYATQLGRRWGFPGTVLTAEELIAAMSVKR